MKINTNYYTQNIYHKTPQIQTAFGSRKPYLTSLEFDRFEKSDKPPVTEDEKTLQAIKKSLDAEHFIGSGGEGKVYRLGKSDFVVKIPYDALFSLDKDFEKIPPQRGDKHNHIVARYKNDVTIIKYIEGRNLFAYRDYSPITRFPVESFSKLLKQICDARENNLVYDYFPGNLIVNEKNKTLTAIDFFVVKNTDITKIDFFPLNSIHKAFGNDPSSLSEISRILLHTGLNEFEPNKKTCTDTKNLNLNFFARQIQEDVNEPRIIQYPVEWRRLKGNLMDIQHLKTLEQNGENVYRELKEIISESRELVDFIFKTKDFK